MRIRDIANARPRFGYLRIHLMLRREGWKINRKRVHRLYKLEGLQVTHLLRPPESVPSHIRAERCAWSIFGAGGVTGKKLFGYIQMERPSALRDGI
ncbi:MAG: hypothetical protein COR54_02215 [Elusimicrobia bacterium CG22_combo_CG10-13_8_21_14_all_63_91]|nr:MAG: hypothetical protein COR54_02215 [Elusimicrobia bacterium CG22_combo_CG10-13_8_21_14_all_63_91]PJA14699.1 MAG: hypothetical protein COX66_11840 [Elusimicrobia bacterium CG_4_10_14_0_2_um_filter_63_34]